MPLLSYNVDLYGNIYTKSTIGGVEGVGIADDLYGSAEYLGGGVFLTAAHIFDAYNSANTEFRYSSAGLIDFPDKGGYTIQNPKYLGDYQPSSMNPLTYAAGQPHYDLASFTVPQLSSGIGSGLSPIVAFADTTSANNFLSSAKTVTLASGTLNSGASGTFDVVTADGQFQSSVKTQDGDSGGAAMVVPQGQSASYIAGVVSTSFGKRRTGDQASGPTIFSYLSTQAYKQLIGATPVGTDFGGVVDLLIGSQPSEVIRGSNRKADILTNGNNDLVLAGTGGGIVNTGTGQNDVVFLPSAVGQTGSGTTVVVSPGTKTIVGGGPGDRLVIPTDRLLSSGSISDTSSTIQLVGGSYSDNSDGITRGALSPWVSVDDPGHMDASFAADSAIGGYSYSVGYELERNDSGGNDLKVQFSASDWSSSLVLKDFQDGDYGLKFFGIGTDANIDIDSPDFQSQLEGKIKKLQQYDEQYTKSSVPFEQQASAIDDDPATIWAGSSGDQSYTGPDAATLADDYRRASDDPGADHNSIYQPRPAPPDYSTISASQFMAERASVDAQAGGFKLVDTASNIVAVVDGLNADGALTGITVSDAATTPLDLTVAQALTDLVAIGKLQGSGLVIDLQDTAAALGALTPQQIATLAADKVAAVTSTDAGLALDAAQALAFVAASVQLGAAGGGPVTLTDTASAIAALTPAQLAGLSSIGVTALSASDGALVVTAAQAASVTASGLTVGGPYGVEVDTGATVAAFAPAVVEQGQTTVIGTVTPGLAGDSLSLAQTSGTGTLALGAVQADGTRQVIYTAPATIAATAADAVGYTVTDQLGNQTGGSASVGLDPGASAAPVTPAAVGQGQTTVVGIVTPGLPGDILSLAQTSGAGTLALGAVQADGTQQVIYTAPASITASAPDPVSYTVMDQHGDAAASGSATVQLEASRGSAPINYPTADFLPDSNSTTDLTQARGLFIGDYVDSRNDEAILWSTTSGSDTVQLHDYGGPQRSTLNLGDLTAAAVTLTRVANDLQVENTATGAVLTVRDQFAGNNSGVSSIVFADATVSASAVVAPYRPTGNIVPASGSQTDLTHAAGLYIGDYWDSTNDDTILWSSTSGSDTVQLHDYGGPQRSTLNLGDLTAAAVTLTRVANDLQVENTATGAVLTVRDQFAGNNSGVASIAFADATMSASAVVAPYRPTGDIVPATGTETDLTHAAGLYIGDYWDSTNDDTILWSSTSGSDTVQLHDYGGPQRSTLNLSDLAAAAVTLTRVANDLQVENNATGAVLTVRDQFAGNNSGVASIAFADGTVLGNGQIAAAALARPAAGTVVNDPSDMEIVLGPGDGTGVQGHATSSGLKLDWSSTSGSSSNWFWSNANAAEGSDPSSLNLTDLNPSDVTLSRVSDPNWGGAIDNLVVTNNATGKILTITREFSGYSGDGVGSIHFVDGTVLDHDQIAAAASANLQAGSADVTLNAPTAPPRLRPAPATTRWSAVRATTRSSTRPSTAICSSRTTRTRARRPAPTRCSSRTSMRPTSASPSRTAISCSP